jgi:hypothetical protein
METARVDHAARRRSGGVAARRASYGIDHVDVYRRAASYVDRILRGEKPANLPVQAPTKFELIVNLTGPGRYRRISDCSGTVSGDPLS